MVTFILTQMYHSTIIQLTAKCDDSTQKCCPEQMRSIIEHSQNPFVNQWLFWLFGNVELLPPISTSLSRKYLQHTFLGTEERKELTTEKNQT